MMTKYVLIAYIYCLGMYGGFCLLLYFLILNKKGAREMNYKATCIYDDMTVVIENGVEISRTFQDNRIKFNPLELIATPE